MNMDIAGGLSVQHLVRPTCDLKNSANKLPVILEDREVGNEFFDFFLN